MTQAELDEAQSKRKLRNEKRAEKIETLIKEAEPYRFPPPILERTGRELPISGAAPTTRRITAPPGVSLTKQSFKDDCDINNIVARNADGHAITHLNRGEPQYGDFTNATDYLAARTQVMAAQADFDALPSNVRERMDNDPANLLAFMSDESNSEEAVELGLLPKPEPQASSVPTPLPPKPEPTSAPSPEPQTGGKSPVTI